MSQAEKRQGSSRPRGLLIAHGESSRGDELQTGFRDQGFAVWLANDGQEAVDLYRLHAGEIDAVLLDLRLAKLDGPQTLAKMQQLNPAVRCFFMSSNLGKHTVNKLSKLGAAGVLMKPFSFSYVAKMLSGSVK